MSLGRHSHTFDRRTRRRHHQVSHNILIDGGVHDRRLLTGILATRRIHSCQAFIQVVAGGTEPSAHFAPLSFLSLRITFSRFLTFVHHGAFSSFSCWFSLEILLLSSLILTCFTSPQRPKQGKAKKTRKFSVMKRRLVGDDPRLYVDLTYTANAPRDSGSPWPGSGYGRSFVFGLQFHPSAAS